MRSLERIDALLPSRSSVCLFVRLSVCLSGTGVHCDHTVHFGADFSLWLDSPMFWLPWNQSMSTNSQPSFSSSTRKRDGVWICKLGVISEEQLKIEVKLLLSANRKSYMSRQLPQQRMIFSDLEWPFHLLTPPVIGIIYLFIVFIPDMWFLTSDRTAKIADSGLTIGNHRRCPEIT